MKKKRTVLEIFSLSFLDIISCGFGAVVLLVLISKGNSQPIQSDSTEVVASTDVAVITELLSEVIALEKHVNQLSHKISKAKSKLNSQQQTHANTQQSLPNLEQTLEELNQQLDTLDRANEDIIRQQQKLSSVSMADSNAVQKAGILKANKPTDKPIKEIGGIPVDSEYIIFIVDTSGSMDKFKPTLLRLLDNILTAHPIVKGFQIMNDNGRYLVSNTKGKWIKDSKARRKNALNFLSRWTPDSNSSPVEGLVTALKTYAKPGVSLSIYIFGDDFNDRVSYDQVVQTLNMLNRDVITGKPKAKVHGIGFGGSERYSILMREITNKNSGTFIGLSP